MGGSCEEWDGAVAMQECESICARLSLDSKGDSVSYRETLKFREMVDSEEVSGCLGLTCVSTCRNAGLSVGLPCVPSFIGWHLSN